MEYFEEVRRASKRPTLAFMVIRRLRFLELQLSHNTLSVLRVEEPLDENLGHTVVNPEVSISS